LKALLLLLPIALFSFNENDVSFEENLTNTDDNFEVSTHDSFLSDVEYGRMLYKSPRGISCSQCHGDAGKGGQHIVTYYDKKRNPKILRGVNIRSYSLEELRASLKNEYKENNRTKRHKIMPMYYLTEKEIHAIYSYLQYDEKKEK